MRIFEGMTSSHAGTGFSPISAWAMTNGVISREPTFIDQEVTVRHQLAGHVAGLGETCAVHHVVEARLKDLQQVLTGLAGLALCFLVVVRELLLEHAVHAGCLLLLTKLQQVLAVLGTTTAMLARGVGTLLEGALRRFALGALEEQLHLLATATLAVGGNVTCH